MNGRRTVSASLFCFLVLSILTLSGCGKVDAKYPVISAVSPASGSVGTQVVITGIRFGATAAANSVSFNGVQATVLSATTTRIVTVVPAGATSGYITVGTHDGYCSSPGIFFVPILLGGGFQGAPLILVGTVDTVAGTAGSSGIADGAGGLARFATPAGVTTDGTNLYIADSGNHTIRRMVIASGQVSTIAGVAGTAGALDGIGQGAYFNAPQGVTTDGTSLFICDTGNHTIRQLVLATSQVSTIAGIAGVPGVLDGFGVSARFNLPQGITTDGNILYICDTGNHTIRQLELATGRVVTIAGGAGQPAAFDADGLRARFNNPVGITTNGANLYIADTNNHTIRQVTLVNNVVTTIAGVAGIVGSQDGSGSGALFNNPQGITTDGSSLFLADSGNNTIRRLNLTTLQVTTLAGLPPSSGAANGTGSVALFNNPSGIVSDSRQLLVSDAANNTIRTIK